ncbi:hypothetical protein [Massilia sp. METH4]|uniref:hypothetical protein n=1 Tax=Massilia sp. METH4 TaxID=3123041 RepID=UPI0030D5C546
MTLRRPELGRISSSGDGPRGIYSADPYLVVRAMIKVTFDQLRLDLHYVETQRKGWISAPLGFYVARFERQIEQARAAVEAFLQ